MKRLCLVLAGLLLLAACSGSYQEPGFAAYCQAHPGVGNCP